MKNAAFFTACFMFGVIIALVADAIKNPRTPEPPPARIIYRDTVHLYYDTCATDFITYNGYFRFPATTLVITDTGCGTTNIHFNQ